MCSLHYYLLLQTWRAPSFANDYEGRALLVSYGVVQAPLFLWVYVSCRSLDADRGRESPETICHRTGRTIVVASCRTQPCLEDVEHLTQSWLNHHAVQSLVVEMNDFILSTLPRLENNLVRGALLDIAHRLLKLRADDGRLTHSQRPPGTGSASCGIGQL